VEARSGAKNAEVASGTLNEAGAEVLERLVDVIEYRDDLTGQHPRRVGRVSALIAQAIGIDEDSASLIRRAAMLHDLGKIGVPDEILRKPGKLNSAERTLMQRHVAIGRAILSEPRCGLLQMAEEIAFTHHEWWDGSGYMSGLAGLEIPLVGRIVAIADVFDALTNDRPYRERWPLNQALAEIKALSGRQFDPELVEAFSTLDSDALI
jgi:HD-GYP domain-containing protein (c-di-GMP phosphodiesterase class II)